MDFIVFIKSDFRWHVGPSGQPPIATCRALVCCLWWCPPVDTRTYKAPVQTEAGPSAALSEASPLGKLCRVCPCRASRRATVSSPRTPA
jgi:hypothetical protein